MRLLFRGTKLGYATLNQTCIGYRPPRLAVRNICKTTSVRSEMTGWGYTRENGPDHWGNYVSIATEGKRQSPIDIVPESCQFDPKLLDPALRYSYTPQKATVLLNTGLSAQVKYDSDGSLLEGGPLSDKYKIAQFHLHWGKTSKTGSEHTVNGSMYAAELHIVHWNTKYAGFADAADKPDGLCVLGVFLQSGSGAKEHLGLKKMTELLAKVPHHNDEVIMSGGFDPLCVLPDNKRNYWTYLGSLTTPPLFESVTWIVFQQPISVSEAQMEAFRAMNQNQAGKPAVEDEFGGKICENYRPPQPLHGRTVRASFQ